MERHISIFSSARQAERHASHEFSRDVTEGGHIAIFLSHLRFVVFQFLKSFL